MPWPQPMSATRAPAWSRPVTPSRAAIHPSTSDARALPRTSRNTVCAALRSDVGDDRAMEPLPTSHLRIARPSRDLRASERFWVDGLGLDVLFRAGFSAEGGHTLLMVGWPDAAWHLELVSDPYDETPAAPTEEDLLVLYLNGEVDAGVVSRLIVAGGTQVAARNPYWDHGAVMIVDPDGYRLVLTSRRWP